jgi:toxin ParE1/3/4
MPNAWWTGSPSARPRSPATPFPGRMVPKYQADDIRELIEKLYRIIYRVKKDQIDVLAVIHGERLPPDEL